MTVIVCVIGLCDKLQGTTHREALSSYSSSSSGGGSDDDGGGDGGDDDDGSDVDDDDDDDSYCEEVSDDLDEMGISTAKENAIWTDDLVR